MTVPVIAFFNNKGGVGKTSLVYHLAWMLADLGYRVVAADLDPQANLTSAFLDENTLEKLWPDSGQRLTAWGAIKPWQEAFGGIGSAPLWATADQRLALLPGDLELSSFEDALSAAWPLSANGDIRSYRVMGAFWTVLSDAAAQHSADVVLLDVGPSLGAINRAALIASTHVVVPMAPDLFSLQGLRNLGPTLRIWRDGWGKRLEELPTSLDAAELPVVGMNVLGYVVLQHGVRLDRPVKAYQRWMDQIPREFRRSVLNNDRPADVRVSEDPYCLAQLKHYHSLMPLAQEARKPVFALRAADGALGGHFQAAQSAYVDYRKLAEEVLERSRVGPT
jgi:cellulose biosynthesis protein BcsQ